MMAAPIPIRAGSCTLMFLMSMSHSGVASEVPAGQFGVDFPLGAAFPCGAGEPSVPRSGQGPEHFHQPVDVLLNQR